MVGRSKWRGWHHDARDRISRICSSKSRKQSQFTLTKAPVRVESASTSLAIPSWFKGETAPGHLGSQSNQSSGASEFREYQANRFSCRCSANSIVSLWTPPQHCNRKTTAMVHSRRHMAAACSFQETNRCTNFVIVSALSKGQPVTHNWRAFSPSCVARTIPISSVRNRSVVFVTGQSLLPPMIQSQICFIISHI